jgi:hypothetical protein
MTKFHAVMLDETRCEFGVSFEAKSREAAYRYLEENYEESRCIQLESAADTRKREKRMYDQIQREYEDGYGGYDYDDY